MTHVIRLLLLSFFLAAPASTLAQPVPAPEDDYLEQRQNELSQRSQTRGVHLIDFSVAATHNASWNRREFTIGLRFASPLWTSRLWWRFRLSIRAAAQLFVSSRANFYPAVAAEGGARFVIFSSLSLELFTGPHLGAQLGRSGLVPVAGWASNAAWLFHPFADNRRRFRLGFELSNLQPFLVETDDSSGWLPFRHIGGFVGYQGVF